jgi:hypothetical protein
MNFNLASEEDIKKLTELVEESIRLQKVAIKLHATRMTVNVADIADLEGTSTSNIRLHQEYLLPRYGVSGYPGGKRRWNYQEYLDWSARPVEERRREYMAMLEAQARKEAAGKNKKA